MKKITFLIVLLTLFSSWYGTAQITTYPYSEDFEAGDGGWVATNGANGTWALGAPTANVINSAASGANAWATNLSGNYNASENSFVQSPVFDLSTLSAPSIQFSIWWNAEFSWDGMVLQSSIDSGASWQNVGAFGDPNNWYNDTTINGNPGGQQVGWSGRGTANGSQGWVVARHALTGLAGQSNVILRFAFGSDTSVQDNGVAFDLVSIFEVSCPEPSGLAVDSQTATTANISWTPGGSETDWEVAVQPAGTGEPAGAGDPTTANAPYIATSLNPATAYEVYVRSVCGSEFSPWVGPVNFLTECTSFTAPYTEGFENAGAIPICWTMSGGEVWRFSNTGAGNHIGNNGTITGSTATNGYFAWVDSSGAEAPAVLLSPLVDVSTLTAPALSFYEISNNEGNANSTLTVEVWDGAAWNNVGVYNTNTNGWELKTINLSGLTITGDIQARFTFSETVSGDFYDDIAIDDVTFDELPTCPSPSTLTATNVTSNGAELGWTETGSATLWNVEVVPTGTAATGVPTASGVSNPYTVSGLNPVTSYDFYVQAQCGSDTSIWVGPSTFVTLCDVFTPDYLATFDTFLQDCWDEADNGNPTTGPTNLGDSSWGVDGFANVGFTGAYKINLWLAAKSDWLLSPLFDLTGGPFQVELDLAIMQFGSSVNAGTLGSDDQVQLLITNDGGATWTALLSWDSTSAVPAGGEHYVVNLAAYSGQTVQFGIWASEGTVDDTPDNDVSVDNFQVRNIPTCNEPSGLTATNLSLTSTEVGWTENGTATLWNIEYGPDGFVQGTGTVVTDVTNPYTIENLSPDTLYDFYVQSNCGAVDGLSSWTGPGGFYTGYCASVPTSNDGQGVTNVTIGVTDFPSFGDVTYENHTATVVNVFQGVDTNVSISFATGFTYNTNIWIDFNDDLVFDASEIVFQGVSTNANPTILDATFTMPADAALGEHRMRIGTADFGQTTPNPCFSGSFGVTLDFTVNILVLDCVLPEADFTVSPDCDNDQFFIDVNVTSLGDATSLVISNNFDAATIQATALDVYPVGPFAFGTNVKVFVTNEQNGNCVISSPTLGLIGCPPENDECANAIVASVNADGTCALVTPGTILAASPSNVPAGSCGGNPNDDVWFQFTALHENETISLQNIAGGTTDLDHAIYSGTCGSLTELYCSPNTASAATGLTIGQTYFIRVFSAGLTEATSTFNLCITESPGNVIVDQTTYTPEQLIQDVLINTPCAVVSNITYSTGTNFGQENGIGYFSGNGVGFPFTDGIILTTGDALEASGPNTTAMSSGTSAWLGDPELNAAVGITNSNNATIIEFDFVPLADEISFEFLMASEEYNGGSFECNYSDAFAFLLTDQNGNTTNLAVLPGTTTPILVTNIHPENTSCPAINEEYFGGYTPQDLPPISFDGRTEVFTAYSQVIIGQNYHIKLVIADATDSALDSGVYLKAGSFDLGEIELGDDITIEAGTAVCDGSEIILETNIPNVTHTWYLDGLELAETSSTLVVTEAGEYTVQIVFSAQCFLEDVITIEFFPNPVINLESIDLFGCSDTDITTFNLQDNDLPILGTLSPAEYSVTYYLTEQEAIEGSATGLSSPYTNLSNPQTIWARVTNNTTACFETTSFALIVNPLPVANDSPDVTGCDFNDDGVADYDITVNEAVILGSQTDMSVTYYTSQSEADAGTPAITNPQAYSTTLTTIYVRVENNATGCYNTTTFGLTTGEAPVTTFATDFEYEVCPNATVPVIITATPQNYTASEVSIVWYQDGGVIQGETGLTLPVLESGFYEIEVRFNETGCIGIVGQEVIELDNCIIPQGISPNNDGKNDTFDLSNFNVQRIEIFNRLGTLVYSKDNYTNEWFGQSDNGDELPVGTYFYTMIYEGGTKTKSSWVYINK